MLGMKRIQMHFFLGGGKERVQDVHRFRDFSRTPRFLRIIPHF